MALLPKHEKRELSSKEVDAVHTISARLKLWNISFHKPDKDMILQRTASLIAGIIRAAEAAGIEGIMPAVFEHLQKMDDREVKRAPQS
jgi:hypothetical protein